MVERKKNLFLLEETPLEAVEGVGPKLAGIFSGMGIHSVDDLLRHYPHRYLDLGTVKKIGAVGEGDEVTIIGRVKEVDNRRGRRGRLDILTVPVFDGTGYVFAVWFNQGYIADRLSPGTAVALSGKVTWRYGRLQMQNPFYDPLADDEETEMLNTGRIIPLHPATAKLSAARIRKFVRKALDQFEPAVVESLPPSVRRRYGMAGAGEALRQVHFPDSKESLQSARKRLVFEEFFWLQLGLALRRKWLGNQDGISHKISGRLVEPFYRGLPWTLTGDQSQALEDIRRDMAAERPMHRLLLGEVGSGKTVVAAAAMLMAVEGGRQAALMVPTEVLAEQHYIKLRQPLEELGLKVLLLLGGRTNADNSEALVGIAAGRADIVIGTHSLIQEKVEFAGLGLAVIDEQHRFGVRQRLGLRAKGTNPDLLVLTATPIPRTLALTLYGDLDISMLRTRPGGRAVGGHIKTRYLAENLRPKAYELIRREVGAGRRAYIVCPLVDESDKLAVKSVLREAEHLKTTVFPDLRVGLLHGRLSSPDKEAVMRDFRTGELQVLIATTVIEVGVDVPEATVMMIEHAERFGLAQLHQLRGRVGRGPSPAYCLLLGDLRTEEAKARTKALISINDGFKLAEVDLELRGEGQLFGARQSGLPDLKLAKLTKHANVLEKARREALALTEDDPRLMKPENRRLRDELGCRFAASLDWLESG